MAAKRIAAAKGTDLTLVVDAASIELFADKGLTTMTAIFFPRKPYDKIQIGSPETFKINSVTYSPLKSIWP
jgi:fructan beta-fructosidase